MKAVGAIAFIAFIFTMLAGWVNNIIWTFSQDSLVNLLLGILGVFVAPVGAIHGIYLWF